MNNKANLYTAYVCKIVFERNHSNWNLNLKLTLNQFIWLICMCMCFALIAQKLGCRFISVYCLLNKMSSENWKTNLCSQLTEVGVATSVHDHPTYILSFFRNVVSKSNQADSLKHVQDDQTFPPTVPLCCVSDNRPI